METATTGFNDAYLDTWTGRRLLVMRRLGELPEEIARAIEQGARPGVPEAELRPVLSCTTDENLKGLSPAQRDSIERLKDAVMADCGQPPRAPGRFPLSEGRLSELRAVLSAAPA